MSDNRLRLFGHLSAGSESIDGKISIKALRGYSAYEVAVQEGFTGTEEEWLASMVGPQGPQGPEGPQGPQGIQGARGIQGESGKPISSIEKTGTDGYIDTYTITYNDSSTSTFTVTNGKNAEVEVWEDSTPTDYRLVFTDDNGSVTTPNLIPQAESVADVRNQLNMNMIAIRGQKADKDGTYDDLTSGTSKQLLSESYTLDQVPYLFRKSPDSDRAVEEIVGGTVGWNQLVYELTADNWLPENGATASFDNGVATISSTVASNGIFMKDAFSAVKHKYLIMVNVKGASGLDARVSVSSAQIGMTKVLSGSGWESLSTIRDNTIEISNRLYIYGYGQTYSDLQVKNVIITDLTTLFGSTIADYIYSLEQSTAGAGVAKLKEWGFFTEDYYEYCEPTLKSVEGLVRKKTVGFNQFDIDNYNYIDNSNISYGKIEPGTGRRVVYVPCLPNTAYCASRYAVETNERFTIGYAEEEPQIGTSVYGAVSVNSSQTIGNKMTITTTTGANAKYIVVLAYWDNRVDALDSLCISLSDPTRNGQYEPYESHSYSLDSEVVLRGIPKLDSNNNLYFDGDIYPTDGQGERRYGLVDLGTLSWEKMDAPNSNWRFHAIVNDVKKTGNGSVKPNMICNKYITITPNDNYLGTTGISSNSAYDNDLFVCDMSYTDAATFKTAMSGVMLVYELATPTTFTAQPYHNPQIVGDTEEFVTTGIVPVGHSTKYYQNLRKKIENLPWNFSSLIAPTEERFVATRNYYRNDLFIVGNILYKASANIANGGTITPDTNCRATTLAEVIANL